MNLFDVTSLLRSDENVVEFQDRGDCEYVHNAWLVVEKPIIPTIPANVTFDKKKLNLDSNGILKAFITLPEPYDVANIDISTVTCEGAPAFTGGGVIPGKQALEVMFKIQNLTVSAGEAVRLTVTGDLTTGETFAGSNTLKVV